MKTYFEDSNPFGNTFMGFLCGNKKAENPLQHIHRHLPKVPQVINFTTMQTEQIDELERDREIRENYPELKEEDSRDFEG